MMFLTIVIQVFGAATLVAQNLNRPFQITPFSESRFFGWKEFDADGSQALSESGALFGFGVEPRVAFGDAKRWFIKGDFEYYFGTVDYSGFLQNQLGQRTPFNTTVGYAGFELVASTGYVFSLSSDFELVPTAGFGFEHWSRELDKGGQFGYTEIYNVPLLEAGIEGAVVLNRNIQLIPWFSVRMPVSISESIDLSQSGLQGPSDLSLSPGISPRIRFGANASIYRVLVSLSYETWTLGRSPEDRGFLQPESTRSLLALKMGYTI